MTQITKKEFIETLLINKAIFAGGTFCQNDEECINGMKRIATINKKCQTQNRNRSTL